MAIPQTFANHTRWHPPFHFFVIPVMIINFFWAVVVFVKAPDKNSGWWIVVSLALLVLAFFTRTYSLKVQDRVIRLEEKLRFQQLLSPSLQQQCDALSAPQIVALRFAPDEELEALVSAVVTGKLTKPADIKQAIKNWRSDTFRV
jgi:signal transduction histidine kinase